MPSQRQPRAVKRKRGLQKTHVTTPGRSGAQDTPESGWGEPLPDVPIDTAILKTEALSTPLQVPASSVQSTQSNSQVSQQSPYSDGPDFGFVDWLSLRYYTEDCMRRPGGRNVWWWKHGAPIQYRNNEIGGLPREDCAQSEVVENDLAVSGMNVYMVIGPGSRIKLESFDQCDWKHMFDIIMQTSGHPDQTVSMAATPWPVAGGKLCEMISMVIHFLIRKGV
ncbi:hypothetical protein EJ04DRAFT_530139 [Polyplosphaeria fusca]|uniref:Uncharacterized protein n=1 Tax=Polyplosphaeria fusca TaxID=682080 RepID=A0A9P4QKU4_9PLEO|nr:hypothetical protein EJ04DRAFT_530139 [Polyplosphaeria fusca]